MNTVYILLGILAAALSVVTSIRHAVRHLIRWLGAAHDFRQAVVDNTTATAELSADFRQHRADVTEVLADHGRRLEHLESS